jgi:hypothetical protein
VAALSGQLRCAVFGKFGIWRASALYDGTDMNNRVQTDAGQLTIPALSHIRWNDELFPGAGQLALFDQLGSPGK